MKKFDGFLDGLGWVKKVSFCGLFWGGESYFGHQVFELKKK